ncbi:GNAT family N-acetyltransferase [Flavobacterium suzhouense]|uniref:GNAT family N-acetyltransferase n=1 Tax=Flavobacterium suzhouense TaxID=1529638 RepID=A0ABW5NUX6_9FLAO
MTEIKLEIDEKKHGAFNLYEDNTKIGEMVISLRDDKLTVYHTEIDSSTEGKGYAKLLLQEMVSYSRNNNLKVITLCPYVHAQFKRHPEEYADIWLKQE